MVKRRFRTPKRPHRSRTLRRRKSESSSNADQQPSADYQYIDDQANLDALLVTLCAQERVAIDTEFHRERTYFPQTGLIQIAWSDGLVLVDPLPLDLQGFSALLE
ncbi:MAG: hypothetical protein ABGX61_03655, partial [Acidimicrobiales bacterium]